MIIDITKLVQHFYYIVSYKNETTNQYQTYKIIFRSCNGCLPLLGKYEGNFNCKLSLNSTSIKQTSCPVTFRFDTLRSTNKDF